MNPNKKPPTFHHPNHDPEQDMCVQPEYIVKYLHKSRLTIEKPNFKKTSIPFRQLMSSITTRLRYNTIYRFLTS